VKKFVGAFVAAFPVEMTAIRTQAIDDWLAGLGGKARNKNNARDRVISFFNFAVEKEYLPMGIPHVAKSTTAFSDPPACHHHRGRGRGKCATKGGISSVRHGEAAGCS
jgi:hypothetical protein